MIYGEVGDIIIVERIKYINTHEQVIVNINYKENPLIRKL